jgi:opacity protein-like surface antigen
MKQTIVLVFTVLSFTNVLAQKDTYFAYEIGGTQDSYEFSSSIGNVNAEEINVVAVGLTLTQQIYKQFHFEIGAYIDFQAIDLYSGIDNETRLVFAQNQIHIPFRLQFRQPVFNDKVSFFATTGVNFISDWYEDYAFELRPNPNNLNLNTSKFDFDEKYTLLEFGIGTDIKLSENFYLGLRYRYNHRSNEILNFSAESRNAENNIEANYNVSSKGTYSSYTFAIGYRISRFWNK